MLKFSKQNHLSFKLYDDNIVIEVKATQDLWKLSMQQLEYYNELKNKVQKFNIKLEIIYILVLYCIDRKVNGCLRDELLNLLLNSRKTIFFIDLAKINELIGEKDVKFAHISPKQLENYAESVKMIHNFVAKGIDFGNFDIKYHENYEEVVEILLNETRNCMNIIDTIKNAEYVLPF